MKTFTNLIKIVHQNNPPELDGSGSVSKGCTPKRCGNHRNNKMKLVNFRGFNPKVPQGRRCLHLHLIQRRPLLSPTGFSVPAPLQPTVDPTVVASIKVLEEGHNFGSEIPEFKDEPDPNAFSFGLQRLIKKRF